MKFAETAVVYEIVYICMLVMCSKPIFVKKNAQKAKVARGWQNYKELLLTLKVDQKLPSTIGTDLTDSRYVQLWQIIDLTSGKQ